MPQGPTLSLSNFLNSAASSSRKRSHQEISRSQSREPSRDPPSKRRRISRSFSFASHSSLFSSRSPSFAPHSAPTRSERDGYDYRRPVMSSRSHRVSQAGENTIDLTIDTDSSDASDALVAPPRRPPRRRSRQEPTVHRRSHVRAPPFVRRQQQEQQQELHEVIDLSDDDGDDDDYDIEGIELASDIDSILSDDSDSSREVEIVDERPAPPGNLRPEPPRLLQPQQTPQLPDRGPFGYFPEIIRRSTQFMFGNMPNPYNEAALNRLDGLRVRGTSVRNAAEEDQNDLIVNLDYRHPAFALGGLDLFDRTSETPQIGPEPYKAPPPSKEGFTHTYSEEDVILCPNCGDEIAMGEGDAKPQVWVVRQCGHVYCGECAKNRAPAKAPKKDKTSASSSKPKPLKTCVVEGCQSRVSVRNGIFQVYL